MDLEPKSGGLPWEREPGRWRQTEDGSWSWQDEQTGELCHNRAGAYTEALTHYATPLLDRSGKSGQIAAHHWVVLDSGFGLGYNSWVFLSECFRRLAWPMRITLFGIECDPAMWCRALTILKQPHLTLLCQTLETAHQLEWKTADFDTNHLKPSFFSWVHKIYYRTQYATGESSVFSHWQCGISQWADACRQGNVVPLSWHLHGEWGEISAYWVTGNLTNVLPHWNQQPPHPLLTQLDAVFHDAFSPRQAPELWQPSLFRYYGNWLEAKEGCLLTYSRARVVKNALLSEGFCLADTPALGGKRGGLLAKR